MQQRLNYLFDQLSSSKATQQELDELEYMIHNGRYDAQMEQLMDQLYFSEQEGDEESQYTAETSTRMLQQILAVKSETTSKPLLQVKLWTKLLIAAAVATITLGVWLYYTPKRAVLNTNPETASRNDIAPGITGATLILASGKTIRLSDQANGEIAEEAGVKITKDKDGMLVYEVLPDESTVKDATAGSMFSTLSTGRGETYAVILPDQTKVWLNAASVLKYPANFMERTKRTVELFGEGYFEVAKDKTRPFLVKTENQQIEVLGTHFNVSSYAGENKKTTLLEGSVSVSVLSSQAKESHVVLKPNQQATLSANILDVKEVNAADAIDWKEGLFRFESEEFTVIMKKIARWYDVEIEYEGGEKNFREMTFGGFVSRAKTLSAVLAIFEQTERVGFVLQGRKIIVKKLSSK